MKNVQYARVGTVRQMIIDGGKVSQQPKSNSADLHNSNDSINLNLKQSLLCK